MINGNKNMIKMRKTRSPACMSFRLHTSWRRTARWGRPSAPRWWRRTRRPWHWGAPLPQLSPQTGTESRGWLLPNAGSSGNRRAIMPAWPSSGRQTPGSPNLAPPTSPAHTPQREESTLSHDSWDDMARTQPGRIKLVRRLSVQQSATIARCHLGTNFKN